MGILQIFMQHHRSWTEREIFCFFAVLAVGLLVSAWLTRRGRICVSQAVAGLLLLAFLGLVFASTVFTRMPSQRRYELVLFWSWREVIIHRDWGLLEQNLLNCFLLFPMGLLLPIMMKSRSPMIMGFLMGLLVSVSIEICQLVFCRGLFEWDDMIHNALGSMLGCMVLDRAAAWTKRIRRSKSAEIQ